MLHACPCIATAALRPAAARDCCRPRRVDSRRGIERGSPPKSEPGAPEKQASAIACDRVRLQAPLRRMLQAAVAHRAGSQSPPPRLQLAPATAQSLSYRPTAAPVAAHPERVRGDKERGAYHDIIVPRQYPRTGGAPVPLGASWGHCPRAYTSPQRGLRGPVKPMLCEIPSKKK